MSTAAKIGCWPSALSSLEKRDCRRCSRDLTDCESVKSEVSTVKTQTSDFRLQTSDFVINLSYVPASEFARVRALDVDAVRKTAVFADLCRLNALYMITRAGSGHIGTSFSCLELVSWLYLNELTPDDVFFSSKGHDAPAVYAVLTALGKVPFEKIHELRRLNGLPRHPDVSTPSIAANTGSLGMGISKAKGMLLAK